MEPLPTATIVRIKRRLGSESSETILVSAKRKRLDCDDENSSTADSTPEMCIAVLKKLATLKQNDSIEVEAKKALENEPKHSWDLKESYKKGFCALPKDLIKRKSKSDVAAIRFKLINTKRNLEVKESDESSFHLLDALKEVEENALMPIASSSSNTNTDVISCNGIPLKSEKIEFVYDLYYTALPVELSSWVNNICEIQRYNALDYREEENPKITEIYEDDSDENSESNWRNDYPDEEDFHVYDDDDRSLCEEFQTKAHVVETDESFDAEDYEEGDFNEDGSLITFKTPHSVFGRTKQREEASSSDSESESD